MKTQINMVKGKGTARVSSQQAAFELKQRVVLALNKIADRDTYQIGIEELDKAIECLTPDGLSSFFSCILDTDSVQKSAVRKECIRSMASLATYYEGLVLPYLGKMVASIVKRLKDSDTVVRDACVDTMGVLASKFGSDEGGNNGLFVALVKPLFEALGEQNKQVQSGSALCLARVIDNISDPPVSILQKMLARTVKLLKNPHFMAKPAVIELNRSIIQAGGASTHSLLSAAIASIQEALKNSDWITRKAASAALGDIASNGGAFFGSFKSSCLHCLESCRFDKVKPVRDTALQALQIWRNLPGSDTPEPSEAGSSVKENFYRDEYSDIASACTSTPKDARIKRIGTNSVKKRVPLSFKKSGDNLIENAQHSKAGDWSIEIAVPKTRNISLSDVQYEESEGSCVTKTCERSGGRTSTQDVEYEYVHADDKQECSSASAHFPENFESKALTVCPSVLDEVNLVKKTGRGPLFTTEEMSTEEKRCRSQIRDRHSLDSTVTESSFPTMNGCCSKTANDIASIRKQLLEIENKQTDLMDSLRVFTSNIMDSLSMIQLKVSSLEDVFEGMTRELFNGGRSTGIVAATFLKRNLDSCSPRISTCTPRPSVDICNRQSASLPPKAVDTWEEEASTRSRSSNFARQGADVWTNPSQKLSKSTVGKGIHGHGGQMRKTENVFASVSAVNSRQRGADGKDNLWRGVSGYLSEGNFDSAYAEALCSGSELILFELLDRTGPVLEYLSEKTTCDLLNTLASYLSKKKFATSIFPWLQQVVDLTAIHGPNYVVISSKARRDFLLAVQQIAGLKFSNPVERRFVTELAMTLQQMWGKCS
ncbi:TORTIFOLIA1-like protein 2 [Coffea arabica]|uniref:TORTIFOLIA1-like protein 2 n=1 Tax=Coffea arabica TaxID=13443 RepID=A0A6P6SIA2_COFAR|nr:TORTIFOLIA1-like protein 2 [Coffea arabica]XP_027065842.1 TORTIFOLIA1-like protein 2 [Coffea arabica]XP_027065843.1 TORTIFOLIA1-like protein 2 [Coffea arabica]